MVPSVTGALKPRSASSSSKGKLVIHFSGRCVGPPLRVSGDVVQAAFARISFS